MYICVCVCVCVCVITTNIYASLINSGIPKWILNVIINLYSKLSVVVRWKTALSNIVYESSGVRQSSSLSLVMFTLFVIMFLSKCVS